MKSLFVTALMEEARPFIGLLGLKKMQVPGNLGLYARGTTRLLITGIGRIQAAINLTRLLQQDLHEPYAHIINVGICGCGNLTLPLGTACLVNKITEGATGRVFIPDRLYTSCFPETALVTVDLPKINRAGNDPTLYDMESSGLFQAATQFLTADRIHFIKVVSDYLDGRFPSKANIQELVGKSASAVVDYASSLPGDQPDPIMAPEESQALESAGSALGLTQTQSIQLRNSAIHFKLANPGRPLIDVITNFSTMAPSGKSGRNAILSKLRHALGA